MSTSLFRFQIELSDVDRGVYSPLDFRVAMHPSETTDFLLCRVLAYILNAQEGLDFSPGGLSDPDSPALIVTSMNGIQEMWIEIGNPSARKLHKGAKAARQVKVYTYKDPENVLKELKSGDVHNAEAIELYSFNNGFLSALAKKLDRVNRWGVLQNEGEINVTVGSDLIQGHIKRHSSNAP